MTSPSGRSYYEIALTNRQVLAVFVVLLVAVLAAFVGGVWVGRRGSLADMQTVEAESITAANEFTEEPLERFDFFSRDSPNQDLGAEPPEAQPDEVDAEPQSGPGPIATVPKEPPKAEPPAVNEAARSREATPAPAPPPARETGPAPAKPAPAKPEVSEPTPEPKPAPSTAAPATGATLVVQVFSSSNQVQAQSVVDRLRSGGFPALLSPVEVSGRTMYRVRIGPYSDRGAAEGVAEQIRRDYRLETWITE